MKIIKHYTEHREGTMFTDFIEFKIPIKSLGTVESTLADLNQICGWVANTFSENYVVMEIMDRRISGGWGNNSKYMWLEGGSAVDRTGDLYPSYYELRCYDKDATLFLLRWA